MITLEQARDIAALIRYRRPDMAADLDRLIAAAEADKRAGACIPVNVSIRYRLEKFEGEWSPEKTPFEVIEGEDNL